MKGKLKQRKTIYTDSPSTLASDDIANWRLHGTSMCPPRCGDGGGGGVIYRCHSISDCYY